MLVYQVKKLLMETTLGFFSFVNFYLIKPGYLLTSRALGYARWFCSRQSEFAAPKHF